MADLIRLADYKEYKNINSTSRDGKIQSIISSVSALIENYCARKFVDYSDVSTPKVEWHDAKTSYITLKEFPVISVISVKTSEDGGVTQTTLTEASPDKTGYFVDLDAGTIFTQVSTQKFLTSYDVAYKSLEITYTAGYTLDTVPEDLQLCVLDMVHYYENDENAPSKSLLGATIDNPQPYIANSFPPHIRRILDLYRYSE